MTKPYSFRIKAGPTAYQHIKTHGLHPNDISVIPAAAGGPKWIILQALDKYLVTNWFQQRKKALHLVGASAGAWRMMCYAAHEPAHALDRFLKAYVEQSYPTWPTAKQVSDKMEEIIRYSLAQHGIDHIVKNGQKHLHVITSETQFKPKAGSQYKVQFARIAAKNLISRNLISSDVHRVVFTNDPYAKEVFIPDDLTTHYRKLDQHSIIPALKATGSIPMLMDPVTQIAKPGKLLWDGALVDYHIGLSYQTPGLVFYPHFADRIIPGWFDKFVPWRKATKAAIDKMIMVFPTQEFVASLPDQKIPDRKDFETYFDQADKRITNWYEVAKRGEGMANEFHNIYSAGKLKDVIEPF